MSASDFMERLILDRILGANDNGAAAPTNVYIGLSSTTPADDATGVTEPSTGGYARVLQANTQANFPDASTAAGVTTKSNGAEIAFPVATADYLAGANLTYAVIYDALTAGNLLAYGLLAVAKPVLNGDTAKFPIGDIDWTMT